MFEFSLENGKKQFVGGLYLLIVNIIVAAIFAILGATIKSETGLLVITIIFGIALAVISIMTLLKLIFGIVVYHAERTSTRRSDVISAEK